MISFKKKIELLADLSINYDYLAELDEGWKDFFERNDLALPFCALLYLKLCNFPQKKDNKDKITHLIYESFYDLCDSINIDRDRKHLSIPDMFRASNNYNVPHFDDETLGQIKALAREDK
jgi:hypothetical protein